MLDNKTKTIAITCAAVLAVLVAAFFFKRSFMDAGSVNNTAIQAEVQKATSSTGGQAAEITAPSPAPAVFRGMPPGKGRR